MLCGRWWRRLLAGMFLLLVVGMLSACRSTEEASSVKVPGLVKHFGAAPLALELRLDRERLTVAQRLTVELRAETAEDHAVRFSELQEFPGFAVASASELRPELIAPGRLLSTFRYVLEPLTAGSVQIPVLTVEAWKKAEANAAISMAETAPVLVVVESLLAKGDAGETISDIALPLEKPRNPWLVAGLGLAGVLVLVLIISLIRRRRRRIVPPPPPLPPHLLAYQALDRLLAADLLSQSQIKPFYEALSDILRHYIEQRFGIKAPEQTTEEFLVVLRRSSTVGLPILAESAHQHLLRDFLNHCDLVKFARHMPARAEAEESVERCRRFVRETEPVCEMGTPVGVRR